MVVAGSVEVVTCALLNTVKPSLLPMPVGSILYSAGNITVINVITAKTKLNIVYLSNLLLVNVTSCVFTA